MRTRCSRPFLTRQRVSSQPGLQELLSQKRNSSLMKNDGILIEKGSFTRQKAEVSLEGWRHKNGHEKGEPLFCKGLDV